MESLTSAKIAATFIIFGITFIFGLIPSCTVHYLKTRFVPNKVSEALSLLNCFAGGVFLGTAMLHLLAESEQELKDALTVRNVTDIHYPVTEVIISGGFLLILVIEVIILRVMHGVGKGPAEKFIHVHVENKRMSSADNASTESDMLITKGEDTSVENKLIVSGIHDEVREVIRSNQSSLRVVILVLALSLHMLFEALAVGLQETELAIWSLMLAISLHKCIVAFSVGLEMKQVLSYEKLTLFLFVFAVISAIGVPIGLAVTDAGSDSSLISGILQSMATGTFFYVTFFEILQREFTHCHSIPKLILCLVGYGCIAVLKTLDRD